MFYIINGNNCVLCYLKKNQVNVLLIDASKAFDCVSRIKLFNTLQAHVVCSNYTGTV